MALSHAERPRAWGRLNLVAKRDWAFTWSWGFALGGFLHLFGFVLSYCIVIDQSVLFKLKLHHIEPYLIVVNRPNNAQGKVWYLRAAHLLIVACARHETITETYKCQVKVSNGTLDWIHRIRYCFFTDRGESTPLGDLSKEPAWD